MENSKNIHWTDDAEMLARYALGHIEGAELQLLDDHLAICDACRIAVQREKELAAGIRLAGRQHLRERLHKRIRIAEPNFVRRYQIVSLAAAILLIAIGVGFFRFYFGSFEWPSKFSSRKYILRQSYPDSGKTAEAIADASKPLEESSPEEKPASDAESEETSAVSDNLADRGASGAGGKSELGLSDYKRVETSSQPVENERAIWLLGTITVVPNRRSDIGTSKPLSQTRTERTSKGKTDAKLFSERTRTLSIRKGSTSQRIILSERPATSLPESRLSKHDATRSIQTLVRRTPAGLSITMYRDVPAGMSQIHNATIDPVTDDSLVVTMGNERIAYRIPGGWGASSKSDIERR